MLTAKTLTDDQIRQLVPRLGGSKEAQAALLRQAIDERDNAARIALAHWARRMGVTN